MILRPDPSLAALRNALPRQSEVMTWLENKEAVESLATVHGHQIRFLKPGDGSCGTFAFRLWDAAEYRTIATQFDAVFAGKDFFHFALPRLTELSEAELGAIVAYCDGSGPQHIGIIVDAFVPRVCSKWGQMPLYEHDLFEVTEDYGDHARLYRAPDNPVTLFLEYARTKIAGELVDQALNAAG